MNAVEKVLARSEICVSLIMVNPHISCNFVEGAWRALLRGAN